VMMDGKDHHVMIILAIAVPPISTIAPIMVNVDLGLGPMLIGHVSVILVSLVLVVIVFLKRVHEIVLGKEFVVKECANVWMVSLVLIVEQ